MILEPSKKPENQPRPAGKKWFGAEFEERTARRLEDQLNAMAAKAGRAPGEMLEQLIQEFAQKR